MFLEMEILNVAATRVSCQLSVVAPGVELLRALVGPGAVVCELTVGRSVAGLVLHLLRVRSETFPGINNFSAELSIISLPDR